MTELVMDALAVARLSRLVTADVLTRHPRASIIRWAYARRDGPEKEQLSDAFTEHMVKDDDEAPKLAELIVCQWCSSVYVAVGVVVARRLVPRAWDPFARVLAFSQVTGMLASHAE